MKKYLIIIEKEVMPIKLKLSLLLVSITFSMLLSSVLVKYSFVT